MSDLAYPRDEDSRIQEQELRYRLLTGGWRSDLVAQLGKVFNSARAEAMGEPNLSHNPLLNILKQVSVLYDVAPTVSIPGGGDITSLIGPRVWGLMQRHQLLVLGMQESLIRLDYSEEFGLTLRLVRPSQVICRSHPDRPDIIIVVEEQRLRKTAEMSAAQMCWDVWDVSNPDAPVFCVLSGDRKTDLTRFFSKTPDVYPYLYKGKAIFPWILYHASVTGKLWDFESGKELIAGTLRMAVHWTGWDHGFAEASWPQRWGINVEMPTAVVRGAGASRRAEATVDPTSVALFVSTHEGGNGQLGQFEPGIDIEKSAAALFANERDLAVYAGLSPSDLTATGDAQSGYAISVSRDGLRRVQRRYEIPFREGDQRMLATAAKLLNAYGGGSLPVEPGDYTIEYHGVQPSIEEQKADLEFVTALVDAGLLSKVDAVLRMEPSLSGDRVAAMERLKRIATETAELAAFTTPTQPTE